MANDPTPDQTPPTLKNAAGLLSTFEYGALWTGQSNSRPWGYPADGFEFAQELDLEDTGIDLTNIVIPDLPRRAVGVVEVISVATTLKRDKWNTSTYLRLGTPDAPRRGVAEVLVNTPTTLTVRWLSLPDNDTTVPDGYLVRENGKFASYEQIRVLTPYVPLQDIRPPLPSSGATEWTVPRHSPYPTPDAVLSAEGEGRRLTLPAPYTKPTAVTDFSDLGVFLPLTRREGSTGFGLSEIADSTFDGTGVPIAHPIVQIAGEVFTFGTAIPAGADLTGGYLIVDWEPMAGGESKRSWARIVSNTISTFTTDAASWLGDGKPDSPPSDTVTFDSVTDEVEWTNHGLVEGDRVSFVFGTPPAGLTLQRTYRVRAVNGANRFKVSESMDHPIIDIGAGGLGVSGVKVWPYTAWVPHWKDNPFMWLPGPEFGYPNEDQQPRGGYVHFRARGQVLYVHQSNVELGGGSQFAPFDGVADARFGAMLPFAWRMSAALGKRLNLVALGVNSAPLAPGAIPNYFAHLGKVGWWNYEQYGFGLPLEDSNSQMAKRLKRLVEFIAPQALLAEGITKTLKFLSACHIQGETDSLVDAAREIYRATITDYRNWLRDLVEDGGMSPFEGGARMPFAQPLLTRDPWETTGQGTSFQTFGTDANGEVNEAIRIAHTAEEFSGFTLTEDIPKLIYDNGVIDNAHFSGQGMAVQGARLAALILDRLEHALSYGSSVLDAAPTQSRLLRIANLALLYVGEGANQITSLTDDTTEAKLVAAMLPEAVLQMLSLRQWSWSLRQEPAVQVKHDNPRWLYAYVIPGRAVTPIEIIPPQESDPNSSTVFVSVARPALGDQEATRRKPEPFEIERTPSGHLLLYTNVPKIPGDVSASSVADGKLHPERLDRRPILRYVDKVIDPDRYSPSFASALSWMLASMLAPALIKGDRGEAASIRFLQKASGYVRTEATHESATQEKPIEHQPDWIKARG